MKTFTCCECHEFLPSINKHPTGICNSCYLQHKYDTKKQFNFPTWVLYTIFGIFLANIIYLLTRSTPGY